MAQTQGTAVKTEKAESKEPLVKVDRSKYQTGRSPSGSKTLNNGDPVAMALEGVTVDELYKVADKLIPENDHRKKYLKLNVGMQRMNLGNRIRGAVAKLDKAEGAKEGDGLKKLQALTAPLQKAAKDAADKAAKEKADKKAASDKAKAEKAKTAEKK